MGSKRILTARVMENMVVAEDVYTSDEQLLIPEGTVLTGEIIDALKERSIFAIRVKVGEDGKTPIMGDAEPGEAAEVPPVEGIPDVSDLGRDMLAAEPDEEKDYYQAVRETKEFQEFQEAFIQTVDNLKDVFNRVVMQNEKIDSEEVLKEVENVVSKSRNSLHVLDMLQCMKGYDDVTYVHSMNVSLLSHLIGKLVIPDISQEDLQILTLAGLLHDVGKLMVPDDVLLKPDRLTISEYNLVKTHVLHGNNILKNSNLDSRIAEVAMRHHERCDGSGYPGKYKKDQISSFARIVAIADTYDAMTSDRPFRKAICPFEVIHMFEREGRLQYDVEYLLPFLATAVQAYLNTQVHLTTGEVGRVVMINKDDYSKPVVKVGQIYYDLTKEKDIAIDGLID
ncbi:MAG: HD domain-containing protein [Lachnospiraceae bacterium]|nr:HD domain-containing protein [Lachnospiraceae bacterium]